MSTPWCLSFKSPVAGPRMYSISSGTFRTMRMEQRAACEAKNDLSEGDKHVHSMTSTVLLWIALRKRLRSSTLWQLGDHSECPLVGQAFQSRELQWPQRNEVTY
jgi:hypothetical protein